MTDVTPDLTFADQLRAAWEAGNLTGHHADTDTRRLRFAREFDSLTDPDEQHAYFVGYMAGDSDRLTKRLQL
jgi:hypothetical protein